MKKVMLALALLLGSATAGAAPPPSEEKALAELPAVQDALHDVENRVNALQRDVDRLGAARAADPDVRRAMDELRAQIVELDRRVAESQARVSEAVAVPHAAAVSMGYDRGLFLQVPHVRLSLTGGVMPRYSAVVRTNGSVWANGFDLHHAQLILTANVLGWIDTVTQLDFGSAYVGADHFSPALDVYVEVRPLPWLSVRGGQFRPPFGRQRLVNELVLTFTDRSLATRAFTFDRDLGAQVQVSFFDERLKAQAAVQNGQNSNVDLRYTARVVGQPLGAVPNVEGDRERTRRLRFLVAGAFMYDLQPTDLAPPLDDVDRNGVVDNVEVLTASAELAAVWRGFALEGEYFWRRERAGAARPTRDYQGGYAQASAMVWRGLQLGARFSYAQFHSLGNAEKLGVLGDVPRSGLEAGGVLNYYLWREHVRGQIGCGYRSDDSAMAGDLRNRQAVVLEAQFQAGF